MTYAVLALMPVTSFQFAACADGDSGAGATDGDAHVDADLGLDADGDVDVEVDPDVDLDAEVDVDADAAASDSNPPAETDAPSIGDAAPETDAVADVAVVDDPFTVPASVPRGAIADALGRARCAFDERCGVGFAGTDPATCVAVASRDPWIVHGLAGMEARGDYFYDPVTMGTCLRAIAAQPCGRITAADYFQEIWIDGWLHLPGCREALFTHEPTTEASGCINGIECASGLCEVENGLTQGLCRVCLPAGASCEAPFDCLPYERCDAGRCVTRGDIGAVCASDLDCLRGTRCDAGTCVALSIGGRCSDEGGCPIGSECDNDDLCTPSPSPTYVTVGGVCDDERECRPDLRCNTNVGQGKCVPRNPCSFWSLSDSEHGHGDLCAEGLECNSHDVCAVPRGEGDECDNSVDCTAHLYCEARTCVPRRAEGETCTAYPSGLRCEAPLRCVGSELAGGPDDGICAPGAALGAPCEGKEDCMTGLSCDTYGTWHCELAQNRLYFGCR
jgi:hypothetical protein